ncbi:MAG TPA: GAF domain-containing protein, partial [Gemmataceae bacterium]|nr:GAF domain-containing protein [Gemmataceae bacterium]
MERYATVAFPVIGDPLPAFPCAPDAFLNWLVKKTPHWLYHLRIKESRTGSFHSRLPQVSAEAVQNLTEALGLRGVFDVRPLEFAHGDIPKPSSSEYAFAFPRNFRHHSGFLALAVGLVAAAYKRPLPPWVLLSGCLATPFTTPLALARTSKIEEKVLLSFGLHGGYVLQPLLDLLYAHRTTEDHLGPRHERTLPGEVRLLLVPTDIDLHPHEFLAPLAVQSLSAPLQEFGQEDWDGLLGRVRELAGDDLLLVQVPTAAHALCLLGYHHVHPLLVTRLDEQPIRVFRVRHQREGLPPDALHANPESEALQELAELEYRLARARARDVYTKLKVILDQARKRLRCQSGDVSVCGFEPAWLRVLARHCPGVDDPPHFVTAAPAPTVDVLGHNETRVVEDTATDAEYQAALSPDNPLRAREGAERFARYQGFLRSIRAYVKVPLCRGGKAVGALYVHRDEPGPFHPAMVRLVEALASRATQEVVIFLEEEQRALSRTAPLAGVGSVEDLARRVASLSRTGAQAELGRELARLACAKANAYRAAVRLLCPDVRELIRIG